LEAGSPRLASIIDSASDEGLVLIAEGIMVELMCEQKIASQDSKPESDSGIRLTLTTTCSHKNLFCIL
jgi:hypothetical protein